jgi:hypothetical protein
MNPSDTITVVKNHRGCAEAHVFRGKDRFYFLDIRSDAMPMGPFQTRERAESSADNCCESERWCVRAGPGVHRGGARRGCPRDSGKTRVRFCAQLLRGIDSRPSIRALAAR